VWPGRKGNEVGETSQARNAGGGIANVHLFKAVRVGRRVDESGLQIEGCCLREMGRIRKKDCSFREAQLEKG